MTEVRLEMYDLKPNAIYLSEKKKLKLFKKKEASYMAWGHCMEKQTIDMEMFTAANDFVFMTTN